MQNATRDATESEEKNKVPPFDPMTREETEAYYKVFNQLIGLLADCTEEEMAAFDSTLRHPPPSGKAGHKS